MRLQTFIPLFALTFILSASAQDQPGGGQWEMVKDIPPADYCDLHWIDAKRAYVVGTKGTALATTDGGKTWKKLDLGTDVDLRSVSFADADHGWVIGGIPVDAKKSGPTLILRTEDGGKTWKRQPSGIFFPPTRIKAIDAKRAWIVWGLGKFHPDGHWNQTSDGGQRWSMGKGAFYRPGRALMDIFFLDDKSGWAVGSNSLVTISINGKEQETPIAGKGKLGGILFTTDGGQTWELQKADSPKGSYFTSVFFVDVKKGWVTNDVGDIFATSDSGRTWEKQQSGVATPLNSLFFKDAETGWAVGSKGVILATADGGKTWKSAKSGTEEDLLRISGPAGGLPWIVGTGGSVLKVAGSSAQPIKEKPKEPPPPDKEKGKGEEPSTNTWTWTKSDVDGFVGYGHACVWDRKNDRLVLTGGERGGWTMPRFFEWPGKGKWPALKGGGTAVSRAFHAMAYDIDHETIVLFGGKVGESMGGKVHGDTLLYQEDKWTDAKPATAPCARWGLKLAHDSKRKKTWLFGGCDASGKLLADLWVFTAKDKAWKEVALKTAPPARRHAAFAYHEDDGKLYLFGGWDGEKNLADTWVFDPDKEAWNELKPASFPQARQLTDLVYLPKHKVFILYGGGIGKDEYGKTIGDTWSYNAAKNEWTDLKAESKRHSAGHALVYFGKLDRVVLYGGASHPAKVLHLVWAYEYAPAQK